MFYFIAAVCAFFTLLVIFKPDFLWSILAAISAMLLFWFVQTYPPFTLGDFGNVSFVCICIGDAAFVLLYTIRDDNKKKREATEKYNKEHNIRPTGTKETSDQYYERLADIHNKQHKG